MESLKRVTGREEPKFFTLVKYKTMELKANSEFVYPSIRIDDIFEVGDWIRLRNADGPKFTIVSMETTPPYKVALSRRYEGKDQKRSHFYFVSVADQVEMHIADAEYQLSPAVFEALLNDRYGVGVKDPGFSNQVYQALAMDKVALELAFFVDNMMPKGDGITINVETLYLQIVTQATRAMLERCVTLEAGSVEFECVLERIQGWYLGMWRVKPDDSHWGRAKHGRMCEPSPLTDEVILAGRYAPGRIRHVNKNGTFDIDYDNGECELGVRQQLIRAIGGSDLISNGRLIIGTRVETRREGPFTASEVMQALAYQREQPSTPDPITFSEHEPRMMKEWLDTYDIQAIEEKLEAVQKASRDRRDRAASVAAKLAPRDVDEISTNHSLQSADALGSPKFNTRLLRRISSAPPNFNQA